MNSNTDILLTLGVSVKEDVLSANSPNMCRACFNKISKVTNILCKVQLSMLENGQMLAEVFGRRFLILCV